MFCVNYDHELTILWHLNCEVTGVHALHGVSSVQFKMVSMRLEKPICALPISQKFPSTAFEMVHGVN